MYKHFCLLGNIFYDTLECVAVAWAHIWENSPLVDSGWWIPMVIHSWQPTCMNVGHSPSICIDGQNCHGDDGQWGAQTDATVMDATTVTQCTQQLCSNACNNLVLLTSVSFF